MKDILEQSTLRLPAGWRTLLWLFVALGVLMFIVGLATGATERTWQAFLINTVFWGGMAEAGVILAAIWQITDARWGRPYKRLAEGFGAFLPVALLAFVILFFGARHLYDWVLHPLPAKVGYLNMGFFVSREVVMLGIVFGLSWVFIRNSLKPDLALARQLIPGWGGTFAEGLLRGYGNHEQEVVRLEKRARRLAPVLVLLWAFLMSYVAYDYIMSLDQTWYSTLFGVYVMVGWIYTALTMLLVIIVFVSKLPGMSEYMTLNRFNDLAKLTFAFAMLYGYMVYSQYLVIWYSDLPEESPFLVLRSIDPTPWRPLFWTLFVILFVLPFIGLPSKVMCRRPRYVATMATILWVAQWFAHYLLVVPSVQYSFKEAFHFVFGAPEVLLTLGFAGAFFLCFFGFMSRVPLLPIADKHLCKTWHGH